MCNIFVIIFVSNGCSTSEELFWKLDALQCFIRDLHWPEPEFRSHLEQRLKLMASDMMETCIQRTEASFQVRIRSKWIRDINYEHVLLTASDSDH